MTDNHQKSSVTLVSGGSRGLGMAIVKSLLAKAGTVVTFSRKPSEEIEALKRAHPGRFFFFTGDLGDPASLKALVRRIEKDIGPIDGLVNNAGMTFEGVLALQPDDAINWVIDVNLKGTLFLTKHVTHRMLRRQRGRVVNVSSIVGIRGYSGVVPYSAAKAGINGITRSLARELGRRNITVNSVCPGYMETDMVQDMNQKQLNQIVRRTPLGRPGNVDDIAGVVLFLLSEDARFITGQILTVDGGLTC